MNDTVASPDEAAAEALVTGGFHDHLCGCDKPHSPHCRFERDSLLEIVRAVIGNPEAAEVIAALNPGIITVSAASKKEGDLWRSAYAEGRLAYMKEMEDEAMVPLTSPQAHVVRALLEALDEAKYQTRDDVDETFRKADEQDPLRLAALLLDKAPRAVEVLMEETRRIFSRKATS